MYLADMWGKAYEMNGNSKREKVDVLIRRAVAEQLRESAYYHDDLRAVLKMHNLFDQIATGAAFNVTGDAYRLKELQDVMDWKKPARGE